MDGLARVRADAAARAVPIEVVARPEAGSLEAAAALLGLPPSDVVKTLVVRRHDGAFLLALVPGDRRLSWSKLRAAVGVNRLRLPEPELALEATGYARGTITPFGSTTAWPVWADRRVPGRRVALGAGAPGHSLLVDGSALVDAFSATVADITDPL